MAGGELPKPTHDGTDAELRCRSTFPNSATWAGKGVWAIAAKPCHGLVELGWVIRAVPDLNDAATSKGEVERIRYMERDVQCRCEVVLDSHAANHLIGLGEPAGFPL